MVVGRLGHSKEWDFFADHSKTGLEEISKALKRSASPLTLVFRQFMVEQS